MQALLALDHGSPLRDEGPVAPLCHHRTLRDRKYRL